MENTLKTQCIENERKRSKNGRRWETFVWILFDETEKLKLVNFQYKGTVNHAVGKQRTHYESGSNHVHHQVHDTEQRS